MHRLFQSLLSGILTLLAVSFLTFVLMKLVPGGPFDGDKALPPEVLAQLEAKFGLNLPWHEQYLTYMKNLVLKGDFGPSIKQIGRSVAEIISQSLPVSIELGLYALFLSVIFGVVLGVTAAIYRGRWPDISAMIIAISGISLPSFLVAALAILVFAQFLGILPAALWDGPEHRILPAVVLGLRPAAIIARLTRSSVLEVLYLDYVRTARSKGLPPRIVLYVHVLRNALIPVITVLGPMAATVLTGSFIIEHVFAIPGLANHFIQGVTNRDYPLIMGVTLLYATFLVIANLTVDLLYGIVDPRMRDAGRPA